MMSSWPGQTGTFISADSLPHGRAIDTEEAGDAHIPKLPLLCLCSLSGPGTRFYGPFPAMLASDSAFARDVLVAGFRRHCQEHGRARPLHIDGTLLYPGFELDQLASYVIMPLERYIEGDGPMRLWPTRPRSPKGLQSLTGPSLRIGIPTYALYRTFLDPSDDPVQYPYLTYDNVLAWRALRIMSRIARSQGRTYLAERSARHGAGYQKVQYWRHCIAQGPFGRNVCMVHRPGQGITSCMTIPRGALILLPYHGFVDARQRVLR